MSRALLALALLLSYHSALAEVRVSEAWARATAPAQEVAAAYLTLESSSPAELVALASPAAANVEIHEMSMKNGVMKMRMLEKLELPAGKKIRLAPGGLHLMLVDLKAQLKTGDDLELTLKFREGSAITTQKIRLPVRAE